MTQMFVAAETGIPQSQEALDEQKAFVGTWEKMYAQDPVRLTRAISAAADSTTAIMAQERKRAQDALKETEQEQIGTKKAKQARELETLIKGLKSKLAWDSKNNDECWEHYHENDYMYMDAVDETGTPLLECYSPLPQKSITLPMVTVEHCLGTQYMLSAITR